MLKIFFQVLAFFFMSPINIWLHRLAGAKIGRYTSIHPGVLIMVKNLHIADGASIKFGAMINVRTLKIGRKSTIGFMTLIKGISDLVIGDACVIGARNMINCEKPIIFENYSGSGPGCYLYSHGSFLPVTEGYRSSFARIVVKEKVWIQMNCKIGPGVTIETGSVLLPGTVLLENVEPKRLVAGDPGKLLKIPLLLQPVKKEDLGTFANDILREYCQWSDEYKETHWQINNDSLRIKHRGKIIDVSADNSGKILISSKKNKKGEEVFLNLADLSTDESRHPVKLELEEYLRLHYGLVFLTKTEVNRKY